MTLDTDTTTDTVVEAWPYDFQYIGQDGPLYGYLRAFTSELERLDDDITALYEQRFIETATGPELDKLGAEVGIDRDPGEGDDAYRYRVRLGKAVAASNGTAEDIATILTIAFDEDALDSISVEHVTGDPVLSVQVSSSRIEDVPITQSELEGLLRRAIPVGTDITVITDEVFAFAESDGTAPSYGAGFGDGKWS